jgi:hypothetical protein
MDLLEVAPNLNNNFGQIYISNLKRQKLFNNGVCNTNNIQLVVVSNSDMELFWEIRPLAQAEGIDCLHWPQVASNDMPFLHRVISTFAQGQNILFYCFPSCRDMSFNVCKLLMVFYGSGWVKAAERLLKQQPDVRIDIESPSGRSLLAFQNRLYDGGNGTICSLIVRTRGMYLAPCEI